MNGLAGAAVEGFKTHWERGLLGTGIVAMLLLVAPVAAPAATSNFGTITQITSDPRSDMFVIYVAGVANNGCSVANAFVFKPAQTTQKVSVGTALAMFLAGRQVSIGYSGCSNGGTNGFALALDITAR